MRIVGDPPSVAVIGAGMSGLTTARQLREAGIPFTVFEKAEEVGGTWRDNTYPGLQCDVPALAYQFSFHTDPTWPRFLAPGHELQRQLVGACDAEGLREHVRLGTEIVASRWTGREWRLRTGDGEDLAFDVVVHACGPLHRPRWPDIPGLEHFAGATMHSARWDHDVTLDDRRIGVIGSGSTGVQIVSALAGRASRLTHFQRTPQWIFPLPDLPIPAWLRTAMQRWPAFARATRNVLLRGFGGILGAASLRRGVARTVFGWACRGHLAFVKDPELRDHLTPPDAPLCKRPVMSTKFYRAVQQPHVEVVVEGIERIEERGVVTRDGRLHELDVLVLATGFDAHAYMRPMEVAGLNGLTIAEAWRQLPVNYRSVAVPGFPNMFLILGPHSPLTHISLHESAELQADYVVQACRMLARPEVVALEPTAEAATAWLDEVRTGNAGTVWASGCRSWYQGEDGTPINFPFSRARWFELLRRLRFEDFHVHVAEPEPAPTS